MNQFWEFEKSIIEATQLLPSLVQLVKDYYEECIKSGFSPEQSLELTINFQDRLIR